jgi:hypothetical protein
MKVISPKAFQSSMLLSSTASESNPTWSSATTYAKDAIVVYGTRLYISLQAANTNKQPDLLANAAWWSDYGPANRYAMFDRTISAATTAGTTLTVVISPGAAIDSLALINLNADVAKLTVRNGAGGPIVYEYTGGLSGATVTDWYQYFFYDPLLKRTQLVFSNIPPYVNCHITLEFTSSTNISVGECIFGTLTEIGMTQFGATAGIIDFSKKNTDDFGNVTFIERAYSKRLSTQVIVKNPQLNRVQQLLYSLRASPSVWIASDNPTYEEALIVYGFYKDFSMDIAYPEYAVCSIEIEGLV